MDTQKFVTQNSFVTNITSNPPLYLRGYEAIEEEINLIKKRVYKKAFMKSLYKLEQQKRTLEQDETINRAEVLLNLTPLMQNDFKSATIKVAATDFKINNKASLYYAVVVVLSGMIGAMYILIANVFRNRKII